MKHAAYKEGLDRAQLQILREQSGTSVRKEVGDERVQVGEGAVEGGGFRQNGF